MKIIMLEKVLSFPIKLSLVSLWVLMLAGLCFAQPAISLSRPGGPPTTQLRVSGSGFAAYAEIDIYFDTKDEALAIANSAGSFSNIAIKAPASALPGTHWVSAVQRSNRIGAQSPFWVHTNWYQAGFAPEHTEQNPFENVLNPTTVSRLKLNWSYPSSGTPSVVQNEIYFGSGNTIYALKANGQPAWQYTAGGSVANGVAVADGKLYAGSGDYKIFALSAQTGNLLWQYKTGSYVVSPPVVADGVAYAGSDDNSVYALNAATGHLIWKYTTGGPVQFTPSVVNGIVYIGSADGNLYAVSAAAGTLVWSYTTTPNNNLSTPTLANGVVYVASADNNLYALNSSNGNLLWKFNLGAPSDGSSAAVANGVVYVGSGDAGVFYAVNGNTGAMLWKYTTTDPVYSASAVANGVVYFGAGDQNFYALDASSGKLLWRYTTGGYFPSGVVTNGKVYLSADVFRVFGISGGDVAKQFPAQDNAQAEPPDMKALHPDYKLQMVRNSE
jgi:outer membrane protein assembly factor BamB